MKKIPLQIRSAILMSASLSTLLWANAASAQDAFSTGPLEGEEYPYPRSYGVDNTKYLSGYTTGQISPSSSATVVEGKNAQQTTMDLINEEGVSSINGESVPIREREFRKCTRLPDARTLLGESICDLSDRPLACDEIKAPKGFPPLPKEITVGNLQNSQIHHDSDSQPFNFSIPINLSGNGPLFRLPRQDDMRNLPPEIMVPASSLQALSDANQLAADNLDFDCRFASYCMQLQHTGGVPTYLDGPLSILRQTVGAEPNAIIAMANLKTAIAKIPASTKSAAERSALADKLEAQRKYYDALVERLRVVEIANDGPSRLELANLYMTLKETKLGFETLREAAENWGKGNKQQLAQVHEKLGNHIFSLANEAKKRGNTELGLARLRNASACYRRALTLNPHNVECAQNLARICREAICFDPSYENHLMLGGAFLLSNNLEQAEETYNGCARMRSDGRLAEARQILAQAKKQPISELQAKIVAPLSAKPESSPF